MHQRKRERERERTRAAFTDTALSLNSRSLFRPKELCYIIAMYSKKKRERERDTCRPKLSLSRKVPNSWLWVTGIRPSLLLLLLLLFILLYTRNRRDESFTFWKTCSFFSSSSFILVMGYLNVDLNSY